MTTRVLVHADGGACHGTPIVDGRCPKCGIAPDTQSLELWPQPAERRPCAGWGSPDAFGDRMLRLEPYGWLAGAAASGSWTVAMRTIAADGSGSVAMSIVDSGWAQSQTAAQIAAEDALRAIAAEILRAVGS